MGLGDGGKETIIAVMESGKMDDYIRRDTARRIIDSARNREQMLAVLDAVPSEDVQPVRHGRWEIYQVAALGEAWTVQCSVCHAIGFHGKTPYCCECGARMDGETE